MRAVVVVIASSLFLAACSKSEPGADGKAVLMDKEAPAAAMMAADTLEAMAESPKKIPTADPQIAYSYTYGYRVGSGEIDALQAKHVGLCDKLGRLRCRIATMQKSSVDGEFSNATLQLMVDAKVARAFGTELDKAVSDIGGEASDRGIQAEDLSKQMIDTQARITAKQALADRLLTLIKTGGGKVGDLVEAERAFADAQEELDAARSNMAEMQGRVALSKVEITYTSRNARGGFMRPIRDAFAEGGRTMGWSIGALVTFVIVTAPWIALLVLLLWIKRRMGWRLGLRWPWSRRTEMATP